MKWFSKILVFLLMLPGCQTGPRSSSARDIKSFAKPESPYAHGRVFEPKKPDLFVQEEEIQINDAVQASETGSLFNENNAGNFLFATHQAPRVGQVVAIKLEPTSVPAKDTSKDASKSAAPATDKKVEEQDPFVKEMLAQLPQLDAGDLNPRLLTSINMRVDQVDANGDALVSLIRTSKSAGESKNITVRARIPNERLLSGDELTSRDLTDVRWRDTLDGQRIDRNSPRWEDEYSLRISGFSEAKSLFARQLEDKRKQLASIRERVNKQLVSIGDERKKIAMERETALKTKADAENQVAENNTLMETMKGELSDAKDKVKSLEDEKLALAAADSAKADGAKKDAKPAAAADAKPAAAKPPAPAKK